MVDVLLINPPYYDKKVYGNLVKAAGVFPPLGLAYLASSLEQAGYSVKISDFDSDNIPVEQAIIKFKPKYVGLTASSPVYSKAKGIAKLAKKQGCITFLGGPHATAVPELSIKDDAFDYLVMGEGEETTVDLVNHLEKNQDVKDVRGIYYKKNKAIKSTEPRPLIKDIDSIPFPAYHLLNMKGYRFYFWFDTGLGFSTMFSTRGCPFNCLFCSTKTLFGSSLRFRDPSKVLDEYEMIHDRYKVKEIFFYDDAFTLSRKHAEKFCNEVKTRKPDWRFITETRVDKIDLELANKLKKSGCHVLGFGCESGDNQILKNLRKNTTVEQNARALRTTKKAGMRSWAFFLFGSPGETVHTMNKTINFAVKNPLDVANFNIITPFPGNDLWKMGIAEGKIRDEDALNTSAMANFIRTKKIIGTDLSQEVVKKYWLKAHYKFYLRPSWIYNTLTGIENMHHFKRISTAGLSFFTDMI